MWSRAAVPARSASSIRAARSPRSPTDDFRRPPGSDRSTGSRRGGERMPKTMLLVGTRKGCFVMESDADRRDWTLRGPYCEGWPVYHAVHDGASDTIYAAAASEWHGSAIWRSADRGETWTHSSGGVPYDADAGRKPSKVSNPAGPNGRIPLGVQAPGDTA